MRTTLADLGSRLALVAGAVGGGLIASETTGSRTVDAATAAACQARVPGSAARCDTDRLVATAGPYLGPVFAGVVLGVIAVALLLLVLRTLVRTASGGPAAPVVSAAGPAWRIARTEPAAQRCHRCGAPRSAGGIDAGRVDPGRAGGRAVCPSCGARR